jgi:hypothetical protein
MFIPKSQLFRSWESSIVKFIGFWGFVVVTSSLSLRWLIILSWKIKSTLYKVFLVVLISNTFNKFQYSFVIIYMGKGNYNFVYVYVKHYVVSNQLTQLMCNLVFNCVIDKHLLQTTTKHWTQSYVFIENKTSFDVFKGLMFCWSTSRWNYFF